MSLQSEWAIQKVSLVIDFGKIAEEDGWLKQNKNHL